MADCDAVVVCNDGGGVDSTRTVAEFNCSLGQHQWSEQINPENVVDGRVCEVCGLEYTTAQWAYEMLKDLSNIFLKVKNATNAPPR